MSEMSLPANPFPGLRPFTTEEAGLFFGRQRAVDEMLVTLGRNRFLAVTGASGSGRASLVRAGLVPRLAGEGTMPWRVAQLRPGQHPRENLARALLGGGLFADASLDRVRETLGTSALGLVDCVDLDESELGDDESLLLVVDQLEELFWLAQDDRDEALAFVKLILEAAQEEDVPIYVVVVLRADFLGECRTFPGLAEAVSASLFLVPRMSRGELREAIVEPVRRAGAEVTPRLVTQVLNDAPGDDPDQLALVQHVLARTWEAWSAGHGRGEPVDLRHYEAVGTLRGALDRHAEEALAELSEGGRELAEKLFKALTAREGTTRRIIRRPARWGELCELTGAEPAKLAAVVDVFRHPESSFLLPPAPAALDTDTIVDLVHESLLRGWARLRQWAEEEAESARTYRRLLAASERFEDGRGSLLRGPELELTLEWRRRNEPSEAWARRYGSGFEEATAFLDASEEERRRQVREDEKRRQRKLRLFRGLALAGVLMALLGVYAFDQKTKADEEARGRLPGGRGEF